MQVSVATERWHQIPWSWQVAWVKLCERWEPNSRLREWAVRSFQLQSHICHLWIWYLIIVCRFDPFLYVSTKPVPQSPTFDTKKGLATGLGPAGVLEKLYSWRNSNLFQIRHVLGSDNREPRVARFLISPDASMWIFYYIFHMVLREHPYSLTWNAQFPYLLECSALFNYNLSWR